MEKLVIKDLTGANVEMTDLDKAIEQCYLCVDSPFKLPSGHTAGDNHKFMLRQLVAVKQRQRRERWLPGTRKLYEEGKRFTKCGMGYEIGRHEPYHPASLYWDHYTREQMVKHFNKMFGVDIK